MRHHSRALRSLLAFAITASSLAFMAPRVNAAAALDQSAVTYNDTPAYDLFADVNGFIYASGVVTLQDAVPAVNPPNTAVYTYNYMKVDTLGTMYLGKDSSYQDYMAFLPNSTYINSLQGGTETNTFSFVDDFDSAVSTFTVTANGANDAPRISTVIQDFTDNLPSSAFTASTGSTPFEETVDKAFDGSASTKYLNFLGAGSDVVIDAGQQYVLKGFGADTANDSDERDPTVISIYGSNSSTDVASMELISGGIVLNPPTDRLAAYPDVTVENSAPFRYYRVVFDALRGTDAMQIGEIRLAGIIPSTSASYVPEDPATNVTGAVNITDEDTVNVTAVLSPCEPNDALSLPSDPYNGMTWTYTTGTCTLEANGAGTASAWNDLVQSIQYASSATDPGASTPYRDMLITATDSAAQSASGTIRITFSSNSVVYDDNNSTGGSVPTDASSPYATGATVTVLGNTGALVRTGYSFLRWNTAADGSGIAYDPADTFSIGSAPVTLYAQWAADPVVNVAPSWTDTTLATITADVAYTDGVFASATPAATYSISDGALPAGLTLNSTTGEISGTPTATGPHSFEVTASNSEGSITHTFSINVVAVPVWTDTDIDAFTLDMSYSSQVAASGYPAAEYFVTDGALPNGLALDQTTGAITGIVNSVPSYSFEITASNTEGSVSFLFTGAIEDPTPSWSDETLAAGEMNAAYADGVAATSTRAITYSISAGALPDGLSLDPATGAITGTPTSAGTWSFTVRAEVPTETPLYNDLITSISITDPTPTWDDQEIGAITAGVAFADAVTASGAYAITYSISAGALPDGLSLDPATGAITGTAPAPGAFSFEITASSAGGDISVVISGSVAENPPTFTDSVLADAVIGSPYADGVEATSFATVSYSIAGALPAGLSFDPATGAITGTPTEMGSFTVVITATSTGGSTELTVTIDVLGDPPVWSDESVSDAIAGTPYSNSVTATGSLPVTYSVTAGALPAGLSLDAATGAITGTPTTAGTFTFTVTATSIGGSISKELTITVTAPAISQFENQTITGTQSSSLDFSALSGASVTVSPAKDTSNRTTGSTSAINGVVTFTPAQGFSGKATVTVTILRYGVTVTQDYEFTVLPAAATKVGFQITESSTKWLNSPRAAGSTVISWTPSPNAESYRVTLSDQVISMRTRRHSVGTTLCITTTASCELARLLPAGAKVTVTALGNDGTVSTVATATALAAFTKPLLSTLFATDSSRISAVGRSELTALAKALRGAKATSITVLGHGDARGSRFHNFWLSYRRAFVVAKYLEARYPGLKVTIKAVGSSKPVASNATAAGRASNRRAEIIFTK